MKLLLLMILLFQLTVPVSALDLEAPSVPESGRAYMPEHRDSFGEGLAELGEKAMDLVYPELKAAAGVGLSLLSCAMALSLTGILGTNNKQTAALTGAAVTGMVLMNGNNTLIRLAEFTIRELNSYGKLLFPVMTAAMAAQGGLTASAALYAGTLLLNSLISAILSGVLIPAVYLFLAVAVTYAATGEAFLKRFRDGIKNAVSWCLKTVLTVFTSYMSITGVISGTTDAAALKAAKVTISSVVPVVGGILSDASEAVLVSAGLVKNAAGIYGILALLAIFLEPFLRIGSQYLVLKAVSMICAVLGENSVTSLSEDFSAAMGLLLAMTGSVCLLMLVSTVCFMKGVG